MIKTIFAILALALFGSTIGYSFAENIIFGLDAAAGFIMTGIREELDLPDVYKLFRGVPITLIVTVILFFTFIGFAGWI